MPFAAYGCLRQNDFSLTFDDGPVYGATERLLEMLAAENVTAGFFLVGQNINKAWPLLGAEMERGYQTFSHTYTHAHLPSLTQAQVYEEMFSTERAFASHSCRRPTLMRPPYGAINSAVREVIYKMGYQAVIWQVDTLDWQDAEEHPEWVLNNFTKNFDAVRPGGVMLLQHDIYDFTVALVPQIIALIKARGYSFTTVEECVYGERYKFHPSWAYQNKDCPDSMVQWPVSNSTTECLLSDWSEWSVCDAGCGTGQQTRLRYTLPPGQEKTSPVCRGTEMIQQQKCAVTTPCSPTCRYGPWTPWSNCSARCAGGTTVSTRPLLAGNASMCEQTVTTKLCNTHGCTNSDYVAVVTATPTAPPSASASRTPSPSHGSTNNTLSKFLPQELSSGSGSSVKPVIVVIIVVVVCVVGSVALVAFLLKRTDKERAAIMIAAYGRPTLHDPAKARVFDGEVRVAVDGKPASAPASSSSSQPPVTLMKKRLSSSASAASSGRLTQSSSQSREGLLSAESSQRKRRRHKRKSKSKSISAPASVSRLACVKRFTFVYRSHAHIFPCGERRDKTMSTLTRH